MGPASGFQQAGQGIRVGAAMRGYSLISVLAAMMILMGVLIPFITLQGRLFETLKRDRFLPAIQKIETDLQTLSQMKTLAVSGTQLRALPNPSPGYTRQTRALARWFMK